MNAPETCDPDKTDFLLSPENYEKFLKILVQAKSEAAIPIEKRKIVPIDLLRLRKLLREPSAIEKCRFKIEEL